MNHELSAGIGSFFFFFPTVAVSHTAGLAMLFIWHNMGMLSETHLHKSLSTCWKWFFVFLDFTTSVCTKYMWLYTFILLIFLIFCVVSAFIL